MRNTLLCCLALIVAPLGVAFGQTTRPAPLTDGQYMTVKDGHLSYDGKRVRLWGTHFCCGPKRSGKALEVSIDRMADAGFNAIRFNLSHGLYNCGPESEKFSYDVPKDTKGSGKDLDNLDYAIYLARQRGMFFWLQFCMGWGAKMRLADYDLMPDDGTRDQWNQAIETISTPHLIYLSERAGRVHMEFARRLLDHVNPYTGKRYGDEETIGLWEMFNETLVVRDLIMAVGPNLETYPQFIQDEVHAKWIDWLTQTYKDDAGLRAAWGSLKDGESLADKTVQFAPRPSPEGIQEFDAPGYQPEMSTLEKFYQGYPAKRSEDVLRFYCWLFDDYNKRFIAHVRQFGKGIAVVPIAPSGNCQRNITQYYAASQDGFVAAGTYGFACRPWEVGEDDPFIPYVNRHPLSGNLTDCTKVAGKPYLIYECNDYRPNPYMVEFPMYTALQLLEQDADGAFWFYWDDKGYLHTLQSDADYVNTRLPMPDTDYPNAGLVMANDEVLLAACKSAGAIFRQADIPMPPRTRVVIGQDRLFDATKPLLGEAEAWLRHHAWRTGVELVYDPNGPSRIPPCEGYDKPFCNLGQYVRFDWRDGKGFVRIDAPSCKAQVGFNPDSLEFGDTKITGLNRKFSSVCIVAEDGKPLDQSASILITLTADSHNTGYQLDAGRMKQKWAPGLAEAIVNPGTTPVIVNRVSATISAPWLKGMHFEKRDFLRKTYTNGEITDSFTVTEDEPLFYARLTRQAPRTVKKLLIIGNSITRHGPSESIGWPGSWGMAATAQDKDFAHVLHRMLCEHQPGNPPQLELACVANERQMTGSAHLATNDADLIVVELGDNFRGQANEEELQKPYEKILADLKKPGHDPLILCLSNWGRIDDNRFIQAAAENQGATYIDIRHLFDDPANRAGAEGHFQHDGVNWHPGDRGMTAIAETIWTALKPRLAPPAAAP